MSVQMQLDMLQQQVNMLQHQMAVLTQHIRQFQGQEYMSPQQATQMALNAQVVQNAARQMSGGAIVAAAGSAAASHPPVLHVTQYKNTEMPQPSAKKLTMVEILKKAQDFQLLGAESRPESRNDSRASRPFTPTGEKASEKASEKMEKASEKMEKSTGGPTGPTADKPRTAISLAKSTRTRIDADVFVKNLCEIAREDDGRMLVHGGEIPKYIWPLDCDGEPYEG